MWGSSIRPVRRAAELERAALVAVTELAATHRQPILDPLNRTRVGCDIARPLT